MEYKGWKSVRSGTIVPAVGVGIILISLWELLGVTGILPHILPAPTDVLEQARAVFPSAGFRRAVASTTISWFSSFGAAVVLGTVFGIAAGFMETVDRILSPVVEFVRPVPSMVYLPLVILAFGTQLPSVVFLVLLSAVWPVYLQTIGGVRDLDPLTRDYAKVYGLTQWQYISKCLLPNALPFIVTGLKLSATLALVVVVSTEVLGTGKGVGGAMTSAHEMGMYHELFFYALFAGVMGLVLEVIFTRLERVILFWHPSIRKENVE